MSSERCKNVMLHRFANSTRIFKIRMLKSMRGNNKFSFLLQKVKRKKNWMCWKKCVLNIRLVFPFSILRMEKSGSFSRKHDKNLKEPTKRTKRPCNNSQPKFRKSFKTLNYICRREYMAIVLYVTSSANCGAVPVVYQVLLTSSNNNNNNDNNVMTIYL